MKRRPGAKARNDSAPFFVGLKPHAPSERPRPTLPPKAQGRMLPPLQRAKAERAFGYAAATGAAQATRREGPGLKPRFRPEVNVRAEARTYLRIKNSGFQRKTVNVRAEARTYLRSKNSGFQRKTVNVRAEARTYLRSKSPDLS